MSRTCEPSPWISFGQIQDGNGQGFSGILVDLGVVLGWMIKLEWWCCSATVPRCHGNPIDQSSSIEVTLQGVGA